MEMGFAGLLNLVRLHLPRQFSYWLMTWIDHVNEKLIYLDEIEYRLSKNQVRWILGIPNKGMNVPLSDMNKEMKSKSNALMNKYGNYFENSERGKKVISRCIRVDAKLMDRAEGEWEVHQEEDLRLFFIVSVGYGIVSNVITSFGERYGSCINVCNGHNMIGVHLC